jgi:hypothetical protein
MKEHLIATRIRPFIETCGGIRGESDRTDSRILVETEQNTSGDRSADWSRSPGRPMEPDELFVDQGSPDSRTDFIPAGGSENEGLSRNWLTLRTREQGWVDDYAEMTYRARMHVLANEAVAKGRIDKRRIAR